MTEILEAVAVLQDMGAGVLPWLAVGVILWAVWYYRNDVSTYLKERAKAQQEQAKRGAELNEIVRNNSATIEACTTVLEMLKHDRERVQMDIAVHENMSRDRFDRLQQVVDRCSEEISKLHRETGILLDRE